MARPHYWNKRACLECIGQYESSTAKLEKEGFLDDPEYIKGMSEKNELNIRENVFAFSANLASFEVLQFLSLVIAPSGISDIGQQLYNMVPGKLDSEFKHCNNNCYFQSIIGKGDFLDIIPFGRHKVAEQIRNERRASNN